MSNASWHSRRQFLRVGTLTGSGLLLSSLALSTRAGDDSKSEQGSGHPPEEVSPVEDLMREHGVLNRILLIYEECLRRLRGKASFEPSALGGTAKIVRAFVEDYHEKLEEHYLFPRFQKAGKLVDLVKVLREQHQVGRRLTDQITKLATPAALQDGQGAEKLVLSLRQFIRMYRAHEAREDTVLFPAFRGLMPEKEYEELGEQFEEHEHKLFGEHGFDDIVGMVAEFEKTLGIYDLSQFTPKL